MTKRRCRGCPALVPRAALYGRCPACRQRYEAARGTRQDRGYDAAHDRLRAAYQERMDAGERFICWRCPRSIDPTDWCLGHDDADRSVYRGPECPQCNYATAGRISPDA